MLCGMVAPTSETSDRLWGHGLRLYTQSSSRRACVYDTRKVSVTTSKNTTPRWLVRPQPIGSRRANLNGSQMEVPRVAARPNVDDCAISNTGRCHSAYQQKVGTVSTINRSLAYWKYIYTYI